MGVSISLRTRWHMAAVAAVSVAVVFASSYVAWSAITVRVRTDEISRQVAAIAQGLSASGDVAMAEGPAAEIRQRLFRIEAGLIGATLAVTDSDGHVVISSNTTSDVERYPLERLGAPDEKGLSTAAIDVGTGGKVLLVAAPIEGAKGAQLVAVKPVRELAVGQTWLPRVLAIGAILALLVAWVVAGRLTKRLTRPLLRLERGALAVSDGMWGHQVKVEGDDEVARVATAFNAMSSRVADAYRAQKEFVGNVSHELRTPITSIAGFAEALLDGTVADESARTRSLAVIRDEARRLGDISRTLLSLADIDAGRVKPQLEDTELADTARALELRFRPRAEARGVRLDLAGLSGVVHADSSLVLQALTILLENATRFAAEGGTVLAGANKREDFVEVFVDDDGPGVPQDKREEIFDRFARLDRSRSTDSGGSGLGLAICRALAEVIGGSVRAEDSPLGGARFVLSIPVDGADST